MSTRRTPTAAQAAYDATFEAAVQAAPKVPEAAVLAETAQQKIAAALATCASIIDMYTLKYYFDLQARESRTVRASWTQHLFHKVAREMCRQPLREKEEGAWNNNYFVMLSCIPILPHEGHDGEALFGSTELLQNLRLRQDRIAAGLGEVLPRPDGLPTLDE